MERIKEDGNIYYIIIDSAADNHEVVRELKRLNRCISGKNNVKLIRIHSFEFSLLSFDHLENWVFAETDVLRTKRENLLEARSRFVKLMINGGNADELHEFKAVYDFQDKKNDEKISAKLLFEITRNTGFETDKTQIGSCFINSCCEWNERQKDDICGLDDSRISLYDKMKQLKRFSVLEAAFKEAGL